MKERYIKAATEEVSSRAQPMITNKLHGDSHYYSLIVSKLWRGVNVASGWACCVGSFGVAHPAVTSVVLQSVHKRVISQPRAKKQAASKNADTHACSNSDSSTALHNNKGTIGDQPLSSHFITPSALQIVPSTQYSKI